MMNSHLIKKLSFFNNHQLNEEIKELKKDYYVTGYTVKPQENIAEVQLVLKGEEHDEVHTSKL